jgi:antitoxin component HigA of HigAB toxin-antitoxin module
MHPGRVSRILRDGCRNYCGEIISKERLNILDEERKQCEARFEEYWMPISISACRAAIFVLTRKPTDLDERVPSNEQISEILDTLQRLDSVLGVMKEDNRYSRKRIEL